MSNLFDSIFSNGFDVKTFLITLAVSLCIGVFISFIYSFKTRHSKSFLVTLSILPAVVSVVIMMVNGNLGVGVAVAGAFSLVRFRSAPGTLKEIGTIFLAMCSGLIAGMGYIGYSILFTIILGIALLICNYVTSKQCKNSLNKKLTITIPENLNYSTAFNDLFSEFCIDAELLSAKTVNLGSMFKLSYNVTLKNNVNEKELIDAIRCRNGNLEVSLCTEKEDIYAL